MQFEATEKKLWNLSVSKIEKALLCPMAFKFQYIDRIPQVSSGRFLSGNVIHEILEFAMRERARTGKYPDWKDLDDKYEPTWTAKTAEEEAKEDFLGWDWDAKDPLEKAKAGYRPLVRLACEKVLPTLKPWMLGAEPVIEYKIDLEMQSAMGPFKLIGYADFLDDSGLLGDWKTTENKVGDRAKRTWLQFAAYSLWAYPIVGEENLRCQKIFLVRATEPYVERCEFVITAKHREYFVKVAAAVWQMVQADAYIPVTDTWLCKKDWCDYYAGCQGEY